MTTWTKAVLLVDDSPTVRRMLEWSLKPLQARCLPAGDGLEALGILKTQDVDLAIVDLNMPRMDGIEFIRTVRADERLKRLPIILLTTESRPEDRDLAIEAGANLYMTKPSSPALLRLSAASFLVPADAARSEPRKAQP